MKDCKCGKIPPCYGSLEFVIYEAAKKVNEEWERSRARHSKMIDKLRGKLMEGGFLDDTHEKVYELNKQMCDIGKTMNDPFEPLSEEAIQEMTKTLEIVRNPKDIMKEKKTKKMTKAEAFEWLDGKKIRTEGNHEKVLRKLFDLGFVWKNLRDTRVDLGWQLGEVYGLTISDDEVAWWTTPHLFETHGADAVTADDILSIEILEDKNNEFVDCSEPCPEIKAVQELLRNSKHLKDKIIVITKDNAAIL